MSLLVVLSPLALDSLISIGEFILEKWGKKSSDKFKLQVQRTLKNISKQPYIFKASTLATDKKGNYKQANFFHLSNSSR